MAAPSRPVAVLVACLILLGAVAQLWLLYELRYDLPVLMGDSGFSLPDTILVFSPALLAGAGAVLARRLYRRGSGWALVAAGVPCAVLLLGLGLAAFLSPIFSSGHH